MRDDERLWHVRDAIARAHRIVARGHGAYRDDEALQAALQHHLMIIGEAAGRLSSPLRAANPDVPWKRMIGLRNRLIHAYFDVDIELVWQIAVNDLPILDATVGKIQEENET